VSAQERFDAAKVAVQELGDQDNTTKLRLYGLFKQATAGNATGSRPGRFDPVGRAKFDAWTSLAGMSTEDAMNAYADEVEARSA